MLLSGRMEEDVHYEACNVYVGVVPERAVAQPQRILPVSVGFAASKRPALWLEEVSAEAAGRDRAER